MRTWFRNLRKASGKRRPVRRASRLVLESLGERCLPSTGQGFVATNLGSSVPGLAAHTRPLLVNPLGFTQGPGGQFLISANHSGTGVRIGADGSPHGKPVMIP